MGGTLPEASPRIKVWCGRRECLLTLASKKALAPHGRRQVVRAYRGIVRGNVVRLEEGVQLPDGAIVTVTIGEAELVRATLRSALRRNLRRRSRARVRPVPAGGGA